MIEDLKDGIKIAENEEEKFWAEMKKRSEQMIKQSEREIIIQNAIKSLSADKLKPFSKA